MKLIILVDSYKPGMKSLWLVLTNYIILMIMTMIMLMIIYDNHGMDHVDDHKMMMMKIMIV